jgi:hypothetical protein
VLPVRVSDSNRLASIRDVIADAYSATDPIPVRQLKLAYMDSRLQDENHEDGKTEKRSTHGTLPLRQRLEPKCIPEFEKVK